MNPLVEEYKKTGHGAIKTEVTEKAIQKSKEFAIVMAAFAIGTWGLDMFIWLHPYHQYSNRYFNNSVNYHENNMKQKMI